ncbi:MAG: tyrosine-type recombinase/integrase [Caulobacteraceae bacterium]
MPLTDVRIRNAKPGPKPYRLTDAHGLFLHVTPGGSKLWRLKFRYGGKEGLLSFGPYPEVGLADAREKRDEARRQLRDGRSPSVEKRRAGMLVKAARGNTFAVVAEEFVAKRETEGLAATTASKLRWYLRLMGGAFGLRPIAEIEAFELLHTLKKIEASGRYETARNAREFAGRVFRYAIATGRVTRDVAADLKGALTTPKVRHYAAILDARGVGSLMRATEDYAGQRLTRLALRLVAHTFPRTGELRLATWEEFDLEAAIWRVPAARMKMKKEHAIPLSRQAVEILREARAISGDEALVFPSSHRPGRPLSENTLNVALRAMGFSNDQMTGHGFRAMASTLLNESGKWSVDAIEKALAHGDSDVVRGTYHRGIHWAERVKMMQWWSDYLDALRDGADILPFKREA